MGLERRRRVDFEVFFFFKIFFWGIQQSVCTFKWEIHLAGYFGKKHLRMFRKSTKTMLFIVMHHRTCRVSSVILMKIYELFLIKLIFNQIWFLIYFFSQQIDIEFHVGWRGSSWLPSIAGLLWSVIHLNFIDISTTNIDKEFFLN